MADDQTEGASPGWHAIDAACNRLYPGQEPLHWGTIISRRLGGKDPLDGISAYPNIGPPSHWHFVTYGMSELYERPQPAGELSGFGFEFTFRLLRSPGEEKPPLWALDLLQNLARYVFQSGNAFDHGHHIDINGPIALDSDTEIRALAMIRDRQLEPIDTPNGKVTFLQIVGLTHDEYQAARAWKTQGIIDLLLQTNPLLVTDLAHQSILADAQTARLVAEKTTAEGSTMSELLVESLDWDVSGMFGKSLRITIGANAVASLQKSLVGRLMHDRPLGVRSSGKQVHFTAGPRLEWTTSGPRADVQIPKGHVEALMQAVKARRGEYSVPELGKLRIRVVPSPIRDAEGRVLRVVGD